MQNNLDLLLEARSKLPPPSECSENEITIDHDVKDQNGNFIHYALTYRKDPTRSRWKGIKCFQKNIQGETIPFEVKKAIERCAKVHYTDGFAPPSTANLLTCIAAKGFRPETEKEKIEWIYYAVKTTLPLM